MKKSTVFALILLAISVPSAQAQLFPRLIIPGLPAVGDPAPALQTRAPATATTTVLGAAIGGVLGSKSNRTAEGTAIGGALGLLIGQMMDRKAAQKAEAERQAALEHAQNPNAETGATGPLPQIDPATGLPIDPNAPAAASTAPTIDPATGLPVLANGTAPAPATEAPAKPRLSPRKRVKKLFGR
ncbi:MAG: glycine zipper 2TM domain-containing protein [Verrucomicrobiia bacterium]